MVTIVTRQSTDSPLDLESTLLALSRYGSPSMFQLDSGKWFCKVEMIVNATDVRFEVSGKGDTPTDSARNCYGNMQKAISTVNSIGE